jgi:hypothetical protein
MKRHNSEELRQMGAGPYGDPTASNISTSTISTQPTLKHATHVENHSRGGGFVGTILNLIKIGTGYVIFALPFALYSFGMVFGLIFMGLVLLLNFVTLYMLIRVAHVSQQYSYKEIVTEIFGRVAGYVIESFMFIFTFSLNVIYVSEIGLYKYY